MRSSVLAVACARLVLQVFCTSRCVPPLLHGRNGPEEQLFGEKVGLISMVFSERGVPQLQFLDKVIDVLVVRVVKVSPSRSHARCVQRQVPWLRFAAAVHQQGRLHPVEVPRFSHGPDCLSDQRDPS